MSAPHKVTLKRPLAVQGRDICAVRKFGFCYLGAHAKFQIPTICPYWGLATAATRKQEEEEEKYAKFPLTPMGVLAPGSAHARPSARPPIDTSGNFPAHISAESLFEIGLFRGVGGVPEFYFYWNPPIFVT
jgi:hypothetical protein